MAFIKGAGILRLGVEARGHFDRRELLKQQEEQENLRKHPQAPDSFVDPEMQAPRKDRRPLAKSILNAFLRVAQLALGLTVAGLYGVDLQRAYNNKVYYDAHWVYAEVVAGLASATALMYVVTWLFVDKRRGLASYHMMHLPFFIWEMILCVLWVVLFGIFGRWYIPEDPEMMVDIMRMKNAVWVDLTNFLLWLITAVWCGLRWWKDRTEKGKLAEENHRSRPTSQIRQKVGAAVEGRKKRNDYSAHGGNDGNGNSNGDGVAYES